MLTERAWILPPGSRIGPATDTDTERLSLRRAMSLAAKYELHHAVALATTRVSRTKQHIVQALEQTVFLLLASRRANARVGFPVGGLAVNPADRGEVGRAPGRARSGA